MMTKNILVTGGTGFLGSGLIKKLSKLEEIKSIKSLSRDENAIQKLRLNIDSKKLELIIGDIRNEEILQYAMKGTDTVIHLAAMKHVDLCESNPSEAVDINVNGTKKLLKYFNGDTFIAMSSDKSVNPEGCYGATKLLLEKLVLEKARKENKKYMIIRPGNILGSSGSVLDKWKQEIRDYNRITITNPEMTRFFIDVDDLIDYIIDVVDANGENGKIHIPNHINMQLKDLIESIIEIFGNGETRINRIGMRKGEKMHELLFDTNQDILTSSIFNNSKTAPRIKKEEIKEILIKFYNI